MDKDFQVSFPDLYKMFVENRFKLTTLTFDLYIFEIQILNVFIRMYRKKIFLKTITMKLISHCKF